MVPKGESSYAPTLLIVFKLFSILFLLFSSQGMGNTFISRYFEGECRYGDGVWDKACAITCASYEDASGGACNQQDLCECHMEASQDELMPDANQGATDEASQSGGGEEDQLMDVDDNPNEDDEPSAEDYDPEDLNAYERPRKRRKMLPPPPSPD